MRLALAVSGWCLWANLLLSAEPGDIFSVNENLTVENISSIPMSLVESASRYGDFRHAALFDWQPNARSILIGTRFADTNQVHHVVAPGGDRQQITFFADRVLGASYHPHNNDYLIFTKDRGGNEFFQFYRYDLASDESTLLTDGKSRNTGPLWAHSGRQIVYGSTRRNRADVDFYLMDPARPESDELFTENQGGGWHAADWSDDDKQLLVGQSISINESYVWLFDATSGQKTLLTLKLGEEKVAYYPVAFSKDGKGAFLLTDRDSEFVRLAYLELQSKQITPLTAGIQWDMESARLSLDRTKLALVVNENGVSRLIVLDAVKNSPLELPSIPAGVLGDVQWHENNRDLGFVITSAQAPGDVYSIDMSSMKLERWTHSETGGLNPENFVDPELMRWETFDGRTLSGFLYRPPGPPAAKRPVIINIHGGPEGQARPTFLGRNNYLINELGIAILYPNVRGSSGYGKSFLQLDNGFLREDTYKDIGALLDWIAADEGLDASRVMATGGSYGGHMTLAVATRYNDRIRCSLDVVGISNLVTLLERTEPYRRDLRRVEYGDERDPAMRAFLDKIAPLNHAAEIRKPLFVVQGKNDPRVPLSESQQIIAAVRKNQTPVWYLEANDEGHGFAKKNSDFQFYATILFVKEFLLSEALPQ